MESSLTCASAVTLLLKLCFQPRWCDNCGLDSLCRFQKVILENSIWQNMVEEQADRGGCNNIVMGGWGAIWNGRGEMLPLWHPSQMPNDTMPLPWDCWGYMTLRPLRCALTKGACWTQWRSPVGSRLQDRNVSYPNCGSPPSQSVHRPRRWKNMQSIAWPLWPNQNLTFPRFAKFTCTNRASSVVMSTALTMTCFITGVSGSQFRMENMDSLQCYCLTAEASKDPFMIPCQTCKKLFHQGQSGFRVCERQIYVVQKFCLWEFARNFCTSWYTGNWLRVFELWLFCQHFWMWPWVCGGVWLYPSGWLILSVVAGCLMSGRPSPLEGDVFFEFICGHCSPDGEESVKRMKLPW